MNRPRLVWLDISKGIAIILMVLGHAALPKSIAYWIYSFHMPLFFLSSGMTTNFYMDNFKIFVAKKTKSLLIPFLMYSIIVILISRLFSLNNFDIVKGWQGYALWFIPVLFIALIISRLSMAIKVGRLMIACILALISVLLNLNDIDLPWNLSVVFYAAFFVLLGALYKDIICRLIEEKYYLVIVCMAISVMVSKYWHLDMALNRCTPVIILTIGAFSGTIAIFYISKIIEKIGNVTSITLQGIGKETFIILAFSQIIIQILNACFRLNSMFKYSLLVLILLTLTLCKNYIRKISSTK